jgi:hypothetical protein
MNQSLYLVQVEKRSYAMVAADSGCEAEREASINERDILMYSDVECYASPIKKIYDIPHDELDDIPFNSQDSLTCREIWEKMEVKMNKEINDRRQLKFDFLEK